MKTPEKWLWRVIVVLAALIPRLILVYVTRNHVVNDLLAFLQGGETLLAGKSVLSLPVSTYSYPPVWMFWEAFSVTASHATGLSFALIIKSPIILADVLLALSIYEITHSQWWALAYALNPVTIVVSAGLGQFDALVLLPVLWGVVLAEKNNYVVGGLLGGIGVALKWYPVYFVGLIALYWVVKDRSSAARSARYLGAALLVWFAVTLPAALLGQPGFLTRTAIMSGTRTGTDYGLMRLLQVIGAPIHGFGNGTLPGVWGVLISRGKILLGLKLLLGIVTLIAIWRYQFKDSMMLLVCFLVAFYSIGGGVYSQYLVWIIPFGYTLKRRDVLAFSLISSLAAISLMLAIFPELLLPILPSHLPFWMTTYAVFNAVFVLFVFGWLIYIWYQLEECRRAGSPYPCSNIIPVSHN